MNLPSRRKSSETARALRVHRLGARHLTRAHLTVQARSASVEAMAGCLPQIAAALSQKLGCPIALEARLLEATFWPERGTGAGQVHSVVALDACGSAALLELDRPVLMAAVERLSGGRAESSPASRLTRIEEAALGFLLLLALEPVRANASLERLFAPRLLAPALDRREALASIDFRAAHVALQVELSVGDVKGQGRLFLPARLLQAQLQAEPQTPVTGIAPELLEARLSLRSFAGRALLDATEVARLEEGDVVLFDGLALGEGALRGDGHLRAPLFELHGAFAADGFHVSRATPRGVPQESRMSHPAPAEDASSLPVEVEIELTRLRLTVGELATVRPGAILPLHINSAEPVLLKVGDRAIARAELVEIEGEVGARILSLLA